jgi:hypothetical protein
VLRASLVLAACLASFVVVTAVSGAWVASAGWRCALGVAVAVVLPLVVGWRLRRALARRARKTPSTQPPPSPPRRRSWLLVAWNAGLVALLGLGFSDAVGRSVRRRGDWFLGEVDGWLPRRYRRGIAAAGLWIERFDLPPEARTVLADAARPQQPRPPVPAPPPGSPLPPSPVEPEPPLWFYPLGGVNGARVAATYASHRFGAVRVGRHPPECELGHCGIDLGRPRGTPVHAVHDGVVLKAVRDEAAGGSRGRFLQLGHKGGAVTSGYLHLDEIRSDLRPGTLVKGGELIGAVGRTGAATGPHLHFELALREGKGEALRFLDPEPIMRYWALPPARN